MSQSGGQSGGKEGGKEAEDPSMEDILASIRRILNDDDPAADPAQELSAGMEAAPAHHPEPEPAQEDVFDLDQSMRVEPPLAAPPPAATPPAAPPFAAPPVAAPPPPAVLPEPPIEPQQATPVPMTPAPAPAMLQPDPEDALIAPSTAAAASASMGALVRVVSQQQTQIYRSGGPTLEDMVRDELRPMVKSWLDEHLAPMVERLVRAEIARVTEGK